MYVKFPLEDLNPDSCPLHSTSIYTYEVTIALKVYDGENPVINSIDKY